MTKEQFIKIEKMMLDKMGHVDGAHDCDHIYRVLSNALFLCSDYDVDMDMLLCAVLLHDIGRKAEFQDPHVDHAIAGADEAYDFLISIGFEEPFAAKVKDCIASHRFSLGKKPETIEAQILYDADKLDLTGSMAIARGLLAGMAYGEPLYVYGEDGRILDGTAENEISFMSFFHKRLKVVDKRLFTPKARELAKKRLQLVESYYNAMVEEITLPRDRAVAMLEKIIKGYSFGENN